MSESRSRSETDGKTERKRDGAQERRVGGERERHYRASVSQQVDGASGWGYDTSLLL